MIVRTYVIVGFEDKNKMATFYKDTYKSLRGANSAFTRMVNSGKYECIVLRIELASVNSSVEISTVERVYNT